MTLRNSVKTVWKFAMRLALRVYARNPSLEIHNNVGGSADADSYSQYGQDAFVLQRLFRGTRRGFFVDVGANHPVDCSNTYLLERNGWTGLAFEPQPALRELWPAARQTPCLDCVIGPENKTVMFVLAGPDQHGLAGVEHFNKVTGAGAAVPIGQRRLDDILRERCIDNVDYLSIDVEGYEMNVLRSIDFSRASIKVIGVENDIGFGRWGRLGRRLGKELGNNQLREFLRGKGYSYVARIVCDDFFVKIDPRGRGERAFQA
jgi:FkbM family methyltransferase